MSDDRKPATKPEEKLPNDATPHNPGLTPKPSGSTDSPEGIPYEKKPDPAQQPS